VLTYLVATGELRRDGKNLVTRADRKGFLMSLAEDSDAKRSFLSERAVLQEMSGMKISLRMLGA